MTNNAICTYPYYGCADPLATNYLSIASLVSVPTMCQYAGCNDTDAKNYDSTVRTSRLRVLASQHN